MMSAESPSGPTSKTTKVVRGGAWMYGRGLFTSIINLGVMAILARELSPADFGLVALAQVILRFLSILASDGVGDFVIYDKEEGREERAQAAFWMDLALSFGVTALGLLLIPVVAGFYEEDGLGLVLAALLARYPIDSMAAVPDALIKKSLDFHKLVARDTVLEVTSGLLSVALALTGWGLWSLVLPGLFLSPVRVGMVFWLAGWRPNLPLRLHLWKRIFRFSFNVIGTNLATTISAEGDTLIIGKSLGVRELGIYNLAWQSANLVGRNVSGIVGRLAMPALSSVAQDTIRLRETLHRMLRLLASVSFPLLVGLFIVADLFIIGVYGDQWTGAVLPLRILIIYALRHSVGSPASAIYNVVGRPDIGMKFGLGFIPFYLISIWLGSYYGILGIAVGVTVARTLGGLVTFWLTARLVDEKLFNLLVQFGRPLAAAGVMGLVVGGLRLVIAAFSLPLLFQLGLLVAAGGFVYFVLLRVVFIELLDEFMVVISSFSPNLGRRIRRSGFLYPGSS